MSAPAPRRAARRAAALALLWAAAAIVLAPPVAAGNAAPPAAAGDAALPAAADPGPAPIELRGFESSPSLEETYAYLTATTRACRHIQLSAFGHSAEGRPLPLVLVYDRGPGDAGWDNGAPKPVVMIVAGIHSGEICGNDALQLLLGDIARGLRPEVVAHLRLVLVPIFNVDGHARTSPDNRLTQAGPVGGVGTRRNARRLDLDRDFTKLESPEVAALVRLGAQFQPDMGLDLRATGGFDHQYEILFSAVTDPTLPGARAELLRRLEPHLVESLRTRGHLAHALVAPLEDCDLSRGLAAYPLHAHIGFGYFDRRFALSLISEAHACIPYERRVQATRALIDATLDFAVARRLELTAATGRDRAVAASWAREPGRHEIALALEADLGRGRMIEWHGRDYEVVTSEVTGRRYARYSALPRTYTLPFYGEVAATRTTTVPRGYLLSAGWGPVAETLRAHGIRVQRLAEAFATEVEADRGRHPVWRDTAAQGHRPLARVEWTRTREARSFSPGDYWVDCDQPGGVIAVHLLEAEAPAGLAAWNAFDTIFERDITLEPWSLEENARRLLRDPSVRAEYEAALADSGFAADPDARLEFFFRRTSYLQPDEGLYPVFRVLGPAPTALRP